MTSSKTYQSWKLTESRPWTELQCISDTDISRRAKNHWIILGKGRPEIACNDKTTDSVQDGSQRTLDQ
jgi:hypothetical protein